jgi:hypothetical protein
MNVRPLHDRIVVNASRSPHNERRDRHPDSAKENHYTAKSWRQASQVRRERKRVAPDSRSWDTARSAKYRSEIKLDGGVRFGGPA